jgi:hypothetical protein
MVEALHLNLNDLQVTSLPNKGETQHISIWELVRQPGT